MERETSTKPPVNREPLLCPIKQGKVRDLYEFNVMAFVTSNRLSVFDRVIKEDVLLKGSMLNCISQTNKQLLNSKGFVTDYVDYPNSSVFADLMDLPVDQASKISVAKKLDMIPLEIIVRGYLVGSAWKAYKKGEPYCGFTFPKGLKEGDQLPEPIITPTTKEENGHDKAVTKEECIEIIANWLIDNGYSAMDDTLSAEYEGDSLEHIARYYYYIEDDDVIQSCVDYSDDKWDQLEYLLAYDKAKKYLETIYTDAMDAYQLLSEHCEKAGILFIDTKFEFGLNGFDDSGDGVILADEVGTPDSSRFASKAEYEKSGKIISYDKQIVRDYCTSIGFTGDEDQEIPEIPDEIWQKVTDTYVYIARILCGDEVVEKYLN